MSPLQVAKSLRDISNAMVTLGMAMEEYGWSPEVQWHGRELAQVGMVTNGWAVGIEFPFNADVVDCKRLN